MKQVTKKSLLALALIAFTSEYIFTNSHLSEEAIIASYQENNDSWKYVEFLCVVQPKNKLNQYINHTYGASGLAGALFLIKDFVQPGKVNYDLKDKSFIDKALVAIAGIATANTAFNFFTCYMKRTIHKETLQNILHKWDLHRSHFPTALIQCFDELHEEYADKGEEMLTDNLVLEVFELIQHHIEHFFDKRYKPTEEKKESALATFKTITDVWKNLG